MKIIKVILYGILGLLTVISLFIIIYAFHPGFSEAVSDFMYARLDNDENENKEAQLTAGPEETEELTSGVNGAASSPLPMGASLPEIASDGWRTNTPEGEYTPPEKETVRTPTEVSGRSGYEPVKEETEEVDEEAARQIKEQVGYGETGDGLDFDPVFYPYYQMLDSNLQKLYRQIYANAMALNDVFAPIEPVTLTQLRNVFSAVFNDHPEIFWLESAYGGRVSQNGRMVEIMLYFNRTANDLAASQAAFAGAAEEILAAGRGVGGDYEKEIYIHNALLGRVRYNLAAPLNQSAYSALVNGQTVCAGYARAFQYLMQQLGVPCYYCTGYAGEDHAWNIIRLAGDYYNVDTTWDDTDPNTYDYFNKTDANFADTHVREELSVYLPACNGTAYGTAESNAGAAGGQLASGQNGGQVTGGQIGGGQNGGQIIDGQTGSAQNGEQVTGQQVGGGQNGGQIIDGQNGDPSGTYRKSLEEAGFTESEVLTNMADYYADCYNRIMQNGGSVQFQNVIEDYNMWVACADAYNSDAYAEGYANQAMEELVASSCVVRIEAEELADGRILMHHNITMEY